jgi:regulatory protein SWI5
VTTTRHDFTRVSSHTTNNPGLATTPQHVLREAQQQSVARPGPSQATTGYANLAPNIAPGDDTEKYLLSPHGTPHSQRFVDAMAQQQQERLEDMDTPPFDSYMGPINVIVKKNQVNFGTTYGLNPDMSPVQDFEMFAPDSALSTPTFMTFPDASPVGGSQQGWISEDETASTRRTSRRISNGIIDRVNKFESMGTEIAQRPATPPNRNAISKFPTHKESKQASKQASRH